ncbi:TVP38/TMEM64 family protein [Nafulsella turpanensis]|uniref:TVP38/TMEM64 family protein n=1 Tax=Nafulsella turpanensis TaxID=1265690 RepID=UPI0003481935|nr:VTT domain-containing protein [Nafulsella turpanensis]
MKKLLSVLFFSCFFVILFFLLLSDYEQSVAGYLQSPGSMIGYIGISFLALISDILLPVPSSLVMILNGKVLGPFWGAILSLFSGLAGAVIGFYLGRKAEPFFKRFFSAKERDAGNRLFERYGKLSIAISKALPVLSESIAFLAGTTRISYKAFLLYSFIGQSVVSLVYAWIGSMTNALDSNIVSALIIVGALVLAWGVQAISTRKKKASV